MSDITIVFIAVVIGVTLIQYFIFCIKLSEHLDKFLRSIQGKQFKSKAHLVSWLIPVLPFINALVHALKEFDE